MKKIPQLETERLILRGINETDTQTIVCWRSDLSVYRYFKSPHRLTAEEHIEWYKRSYLYNDNRFDWMCIGKKGDVRIGVVGLSINDDSLEVSYLISPDEQHKGYATEAVQRVLEFIRSNYSLKTVVAEIHRDNIPSKRFIESLGFELISLYGDFIRYTLVLH